MNGTHDTPTGGGPGAADTPRWHRLLGRPLVIVLVAVAALVAGMLVQWAFSPIAAMEASAPAAPQTASAHQHGPAAGGPALYTCPMHPQIRLPDPDARCPICSMKLVPVTDDSDESLLTTAFSETAKALMNVETAPVERRFVTAAVRMVGKVDYDETRLSYITAWMPGRLDRLFVDYTGMAVRRGDHMVEIYSPELIAAQEEFLLAFETVKGLKDDGALIRDSAGHNLKAARDKLRLLGLSGKQIDGLVASGEPRERITIHAPVSGIVTERLARQGQYVKTGSRIYAIADLSKVWIRLDAYESDLPWLRYGQQIRFTTRAYPGQSFAGRISFIAPTMDERTRTVRVRVNAANDEGRLKPGMFVQAEVKSDLDAAGNVIAPGLAGKWICPMHPEIIRDAPGVCDICGMPLVRAESLGYAGAAPARAVPPLVIPATAPLRTGKRAVVYVKVPNAEWPTYQFREIVLGPAAGSSFIVADGLKEGEHVVVRGAFRIDSERQLRGLPSMMNPPAGPAPAGPPAAPSSGSGAHSGHKHE